MTGLCKTLFGGCLLSCPAEAERLFRVVRVKFESLKTHRLTGCSGICGSSKAGVWIQALRQRRELKVGFLTHERLLESPDCGMGGTIPLLFLRCVFPSPQKEGWGCAGWGGLVGSAEELASGLKLRLLDHFKFWPLK